MSKNGKSSKIWWLVLAQGLVGVLLGAAFIAIPGKTILLLFVFLGLTLLLQGIIGIVHGLIAIGKDPDWPAVLFGGFLSVLFGAMILNWPQPTLKIAIVLFGIWAVGSGLLMLIRSFMYKTSSWLTVAIAILQLLFGIFLLAKPEASVTFLLTLYGLFILVVSVLTIVASFEIKRIESK